MLLTSILSVLAALNALGPVAAEPLESFTPTPTTFKPRAEPKYVRSQNGQFFLGDKPFQYIGTSAHWLQLLDNDDDMRKTLSEIASLGVKVVRTWAFNDVKEIPTNGVWLRVFHSNGTIEINTGENGILRLDRIVKVAEEVGVHILFSLTNNWFPKVNNATAAHSKRDDATPLDGSHLPRNYLSNDFGGMDTYVEHFHPELTIDELKHDVFYSSQTIQNSFHDYAKYIVSRYANAPSVLGWEAANDPRCSSTLPATGDCSTHTITKWTASAADVIKQADPNHLVASGDAGAYCVDCTKIYPHVPPPQSTFRKRGAYEGPLTRAKLMAKDPEWKKRNLPPQPAKSRKFGRAIRGKWMASLEAGLTKRQSNTVGPLYDGSLGVDTEDLLNAPGVDFSSFQFFPDQNTYGSVSSAQSTFDQVVQSGIDWIQQHAQTANTFGKPSTLNSFGLVNNATANTYAPFNSTSVVQQSGVGTTQEQQVSAYNSWINTAIDSGVQGIIHYQWGQTNITSSSSPAIVHQSGVGQTSSSSSTFVSPNDGYAAYTSAVKGTLQAGATKIASKLGTTAKRHEL